MSSYRGCEDLALIEDSVSCFGFPLLKSILKALLAKDFDRIFIVLTERCIDELSQVTAGYSQNRFQLVKYSACCFTAILRDSEESFTRCAVFVDNLGLIALLEDSVERICRNLHALSAKGIRVFGVLHIDAVSDHVAKSLKYLASHCFSLSLQHQNAIACKVASRMSGGKMILTNGLLVISTDFIASFTPLHILRNGNAWLEKLLRSFDIILKLPGAVDGRPVEQRLPDSAATPSVTFSLFATEKEREAKRRIQLPFMAAQTGVVAVGNRGSARSATQAADIIYFPDAEDDFDEEDPDADLEM